jgi:hypothetical protein
VSELATIAWISLAAGGLTASAIAIDVMRHPQPMRIMNVTWPITGLYLPIIGFAAWRMMAHLGKRQSGQPFWQSVFVSATHCGGGCTLGDSVAAPIVAATGFTLAGSTLLGHFAGQFIGAYLFGIAFQVLPIMEMGTRGPGRALLDAIKADTLSLTAFEIGMFGSIALAFTMWPGNEPSVGNPVYWFMMQIAMIVGFLTTYPANWWLVRAGIKHAM